ncbi:MAG TPA: ribosomal protein S18-alanine N-acetyltransferase [Crinalium sp.]
MNFLELKPLTADLVPAAVELDQLCFGGLWTEDGYHRELDSPNSDLWILQVVSESGVRSQEPGARSQERMGEIGKMEGIGEQNLPHLPSPTSLSHLSPSQHPTANTPHPVPLLALGCLWAILEEAHITVLAVHPDYQRQGLGQALLYALMVSARQRKLEWITLEVRASNQTAIALYRKFGFQDVGTRRHYYQDTGEDALILWRSGVQKPEFQDALRQWHDEICDRLHRKGWHLSLNLIPEYFA